MKTIKSMSGRDITLEAHGNGDASRLKVMIGESWFVVTLDVLLPALAEELGLFILPESVLPEVKDFGDGALAAGVCRSLRHWSDAELEEEIRARVALLLHRQRARTAEMAKTDAEVDALGDVLRAGTGIEFSPGDLGRLHAAGVRVVPT